MIMHLNVFSKSFDSGTDLYPIHSPGSPPSSPGESLHQHHFIGRRRKVASESISNDLFRRNLGHPSPDSVNARMFVMPEEGASSADEDHDLSHSTRSMGPGYLLLSAKDRLRSVSLEWTLSNGSVTPRVPHYHTHPPLDFKSLKEKLRQLTGSPDDASKKHSTGVSGYERRKGVMTALPVASAAANATGGQSVIDSVRKLDEGLETMTADAGSLFQNVPYVTIEPVSRRPSEDIDYKSITKELEVKWLNQPANKGNGESSDTFQWSDLAQEVAHKDGTLQKILKRHCQELEDLKRHHELQWKDLHHRISESTTEDHQQNDAHQLCTSEKEKVLSSFLSPDVHLMPDSPGVVDAKQTTDHSVDITSVVAKSDLSRIEATDGEDTWSDSVRFANGFENLGGAYGVPHQLPAPVRSQLTTPSMTLLQRQMESQASRQVEPHIWRHLVDRTLNQVKIPPVLPQMEPLNWYQQLEMSQRLQAAGSVEQKMRQLVLQQVSQLEAQQTQSVNFRCQRLSNHCGRPCDSSQSLPPYVQQHSYSAEPYSVFDWNGRPGISYTSNYAQGLPFPQPIFHQSPCSEVSSYYRPENLAFSSKRQAPLCCTPDQMACLLEAARNNLLPPSPVIMTPPPTPLFSHLAARQSPLSLDGSYPPSLRHTPMGLPLLSPLTAFPFPSSYTVAPDILQFLFPLNPFAN